MTTRPLSMLVNIPDGDIFIPPRAYCDCCFGGLFVKDYHNTGCIYAYCYFCREMFCFTTYSVVQIVDTIWI